jgi:hypothetical protein
MSDAIHGVRWCAVATETWSHKEVRIVIWAKHFPSRNLLPVDGGVCLFSDECMSKFGAETTKMVERTSIVELVGSALRTDVNAARAEALILKTDESQFEIYSFQGKYM